MQILYAEDDKAWQRRVTGALDKHTVTVAASVATARGYLKNQKFDLVICDGSLERVTDGIRLARELHKKGYHVGVLSLAVGKDWEERYPFPGLSKQNPNPSRQDIINFVQQISERTRVP